MTTVTVVLRKQLLKNGKQTLMLRVTKNRNAKFRSIGIELKANQWDANRNVIRSNHPEHTRLNNYINKLIAQAMLGGHEHQTLSAHEIIDKVLSVDKNGGQSETFSSYAKHYLQNLKNSGKFNQYDTDKYRVRRLHEFFATDTIKFKNLTVMKIHEYKAWLLGTKSVSERTAVNHLVVIRTIINQGKLNGHVSHDDYPFGRGKVVIKFPASKKTALTNEEVKALEEYETDDITTRQAIDLWLFTLYLAGMRVSDALRLRRKDIQDDTLHYTMHKNGKYKPLPLVNKALNITARIVTSGSHESFLFPYLRGFEDAGPYRIQQQIKYETRRINDRLKEVGAVVCPGKKLTMHIARHTFADLAGDKIPIQHLQRLYRHSSITTTIGYQSNFLEKDLKTELMKVV